jgi:hypothetical protein
MCTHEPRCPGRLASDHAAARVLVSHPEQGWSLLCNGVIAFDDGGELVPAQRQSEALPAVAGVAA